MAMLRTMWAQLPRHLLLPLTPLPLVPFNRKPKNARSKRHLEDTEPKIVENEKQAVFVRGTQVSEKVRVVMKDMVRWNDEESSRLYRPLTASTATPRTQYALKSPHTINFSKKNPIHPFEAQGTQSLSFFSQKNDASLFVVGQHSKKRPDNVVLARCFAGEVMDMLEMGVEKAVPMSEFKVSPGSAMRAG